MEALEIRYSFAEDGKVLKQWLEDEKNWPFFPVSSKAEAAVFAENWIGFAKYKAALSVLLNEEVVGLGVLFLMPYKKVAHSASLYFIVEEAKRKRGLGFALLKNLINLAKNYFHLETLVVELARDSAAFSLIEKFGFKQFAFQENYFKSEHQTSPRWLFELFLNQIELSKLSSSGGL
ncbi:MAG: GNAT family protein [Parachlamydiales bacterium]|jgi:RimJ/RimL family protein N-acetyltransferase